MGATPTLVFFSYLTMLEIIEDYLIKNYHWNEISNYKYLDSGFIIKHKNKLNWETVCKVQKLDDICLEECLNHINYDLIQQYQELPETFMDRHFEKLNWKLIARFQKIPKPFLVKYIRNLTSTDEISTELLFNNPHYKMEIDFFKMFFEKVYKNFNKKELKEMILSEKYNEEEKEAFISIIEFYKDLI